MGRIENRFGKRGAGIERDRNNQGSEPGKLCDRDLCLSGTLVAGSVLLQARVPVDRFVAIAFVIGLRKGHSWGLHNFETGLCDADRLAEKHRRRNYAANRTTKSETARYHESLNLN